MTQIKQESGKEKIQKDFSVDIAGLQFKEDDGRLSSLFSKIDKHFIKKFHDRKDMLRTYRDIPIALERLYKESEYIKERHGHDL